MPEQPRSVRRASRAGLVLALAAGSAAFLRTRPPAPAGEEASLDRFSAVRARAALARILARGAPHPEGSAEAEAVRERVVAEFRRLGDAPERRRDFACSRSGVCGAVDNIVVRRPGSENRKAILLSAHADSVGAGPGASDDAMGVAALLETARALSRSRTRRPLVFLIDDGEEQGLLGAEAFASTPGARDDLLADINVEARGTTGASFLFETSENNAWLARLFGALPHPNASSLFYFVYKTLPNDTDLTVFRAHGIQGVNFACIGGVSRYHTPRDDLAHVDVSTLQHHGDNVLAIARALDAYPGDETPRGDAVYFDLFAAALVHWPEQGTFPAAFILAAILAVGVARGFRRALYPSRFAIGLAVLPAAAVAAALCAGIVQAILRRAGALPAGWVAHPFSAELACWSAALAGAIGAGGWVASRAGVRGTEAGVAAAWTGAALALAAKAPGASFPILIPAGLLAVALAAERRAEGPARAAAALRAAAGLAAGFFLLPIAAVLLDAIGFRGMAAVGALLGIAATVFAGDLAGLAPKNRSRAGRALAGVSVAALAIALALPPFSSDAPQRASILRLEDADAGSARWVVETDADRLPASLERAMPFHVEPEFPWAPPSRAFAARAAAPNLPAPLLRVADDRVEGGVRRIRGTLLSPRGAPAIRIAFPPDARLLSVAIGGRPVPPLPAALLRRAEGWRNYVCVTLPAGGIPIDIAARPGPLAFVVADRSGNLPPSAGPLLSARPASAVPSHSGDGTIVIRRDRI